MGQLIPLKLDDIADPERIYITKATLGSERNPKEFA